MHLCYSRHASSSGEVLASDPHTANKRQAVKCRTTPPQSAQRAQHSGSDKDSDLGSYGCDAAMAPVSSSSTPGSVTVLSSWASYKSNRNTLWSDATWC